MPEYHKQLTRQGYVLLKDKLSKQQLLNVKKDLTVKPIVHKDYGVDAESFEVFNENDKTITVPKFYGLKNFGKPSKVTGLRGKRINIKCTGKLRPKQVPVYESCMKDIQEKGGGLISLYCGFGKTFLSIYMACQLKYKTLVLVHKTFLQNQWVERIKEFTNARIGIIRQDKVDVEDKDIIIGMIQSISMRDYDDSIFKGINTIIIDEVHHTASKVFHKALSKTSAKYTIGLSATPHRPDGLLKVINWHIGEIIYVLKRKNDPNVVVNMFEYKTSNKVFAKEKRMWIKGKMKPAIQKMITNMNIMKDRNKFLIDIIDNIKSQDERKILVLSGRLDHLDTLKHSIDDIITKEVAEGFLEPLEITTGYYIGGMKEKDLVKSAEADIIFATYAMAEEGLDIDQLNTLLLATPKKNVEQSIGRIMRKPIKEGDIKPLIIDIHDKLSVFNNWGNSRRKYYKKNKYDVNVFEAQDDKCITIRDFLKINNIVDNFKGVNIVKEYICFKYGELQYELEKEDNNIDKYNYDNNLNEIFTIKYGEGSEEEEEE